MNQVQNYPPEDTPKPQPEHLEDLHSTFIRNVEHELRTPLTIMQGYAELLSAGELGELAPEQEQAMFVIVDRAGEMRMLVERVGVLLAAEARVGALMPLALNEIITRVVKSRSEAIARAGLTLEEHLDSDLPPVPGDPQHLQAAFDCLIENAIKFTPGGGRVEVRGYTESGWVCASITDTGIGIAEDKLAHIFDGFYQADGSITRRYRGLGLGLTVAKAVIEAHGGRIEIRSQPGQGSQFTVKLPAPSLTIKEKVAKGDAAVRRILVVDDEDSVALTLQAGLERLANCEVVAASSGEQALQLFEQQPFDLLITDYKMPGTDGMTLAVRVRQLYPATAIMMITAYGSDELREQAARASIQRVLDKPVKLAEVRSAALEALEHEAQKE